MARVPRAYLLVTTALVGLGCNNARPPSEVEIRTLGYNAVQGTLRITVKVVDSKNGAVLGGLPPEAFRVVLGDERIRPRVVTGLASYILEFPAPPESAVPSFVVEAKSNGRTLSGGHYEPLWAARFAFEMILGVMVGLSALVVSKLAYPMARRWMLGGLRQGGVIEPRSLPDAVGAAPGIRVRLRAVEGNRSPIDVLIGTTSVVGREDRNSQLPFVKIEGEGLDPAHALIAIQGDAAYVRNLAGGSVKLGGIPVPTNGRVRLEEGGRLKLGLVDFEVTFECPGQAGL